MKIEVLENEQQYEEALKRADDLFDAAPGSKEAKELKLLLLIIEKYEDENYIIDDPDPIEAIKVRMDDLSLNPKDIIPSIGDKGTVSKVLNRKIPLSLKMIRNLHRQLNLPLEILIQEVKLVGS